MAFGIRRTSASGVEFSTDSCPRDYFRRSCQKSGFSLKRIYDIYVRGANALRVGIDNPGEREATIEARRKKVEQFPKLKGVSYRIEKNGSVQIYYRRRKFPQEFGNQDITFPCAKYRR